MKQYGEIAKQILLVVGITGVVVIAAVAPGALLAAKPFMQNRQRFAERREKQKAVRAVQRLQKNRLIAIKEGNGNFSVELTKEGKRKFKEIQLEKLKITKPPHWDKRWRLVIFDIPDKSFKQVRDVLRAKLKQWEFYPLQKSVWVCPWPCENEIQLVAELYGVASYVNIVVAEKIIGDALLQKHFGL